MVSMANPGTLGLNLDRRDDLPLFRQISDRLREKIIDGDLREGQRLPPERLLARALGVNRSTVLAAYRELKEEGLVSGHVGRGTIVLPPAPSGAAGAPLPWEQFLKPSFAALSDPLIRDLLAAESADVVSLVLGVPAAELLPLEALRDVVDGLLADIGPEALLHSPTEGVPALREALCERMAALDVRGAPSDVLIVSGSQQGLDLIARVFLAPGDTVIVEEPTYLGALQAFRRAGARLLGVPVDADGMRTDLLEPLVSRARPKLIYTIPTFQNPSGAVMSLPRRRQLIDLAHRHHLPILEEDAYAELRYEGTPLPSLRSLDARGHVLYLSTFSKVLFPGLRVGWLSGPAPAVRQLAVAKQTVDLHTGTLSQWVIERFLRQGHLERHLKKTRPEYARRLDALVTALKPAARYGLTWMRPEGGFYVWCRLPETVPVQRLLAEAAREKVSFLPGAVFSAEGASSMYVRLNFSSSSPDRLREGARRLCRALRAVRAEPRERVEITEVHRPLV